MLEKVQKWFSLPGPRELGRSDTDSLPSRKITPFQEGMAYSWEDWHREVQAKYPIRYFLLETIPDFLMPAKHQILRVWRYLVCHLVPSRRDHFVDLRGIDPLSEYTHGYVETQEAFLLVGWKALRAYVEDPRTEDPTLHCREEDLTEPWVIVQKARYDEAHRLYQWWMFGRKEEDAVEKALYDLVALAREAKNKELYKSRTSAWMEHYRTREAKDEQMFLRLCQLRPYLWT